MYPTYTRARVCVWITSYSYKYEFMYYIVVDVLGVCCCVKIFFCQALDIKHCPLQPSWNSCFTTAREKSVSYYPCAVGVWRMSGDSVPLLLTQPREAIYKMVVFFVPKKVRSQTDRRDPSSTRSHDCSTSASIASPKRYYRAKF